MENISPKNYLDHIKSVLGKKLFKLNKTQNRIDILEHTVEVQLRRLKHKNFTHVSLFFLKYTELLKPTAPDYLLHGYVFDKQIVAGYLIDLKEWKKALLIGEIKIRCIISRNGQLYITFPIYNVHKKPHLELYGYVEQII
jgi:hypothetical protein